MSESQDAFSVEPLSQAHLFGDKIAQNADILECFYYLENEEETPIESFTINGVTTPVGPGKYKSALLLMHLADLAGEDDFEMNQELRNIAEAYFGPTLSADAMLPETKHPTIRGLIYGIAEPKVSIKRKPVQKGQDLLDDIEDKQAVLIADNDSTIMKGEILDTIAAIVQEDTGEDVAAEIKAITDAKMGNLPGAPETFKESLEQRVEVLVQAGLTRDMVNKCVDKMELSSGFIHMVNAILEVRGTLEGQVFISSGGFSEVIIPVLERGFAHLPKEELKYLIDQVSANAFSYDKDGKVTGVDLDASEMISETAKRDRAEKLIKDGVIDDEDQIIGLGDGSNDVGMVPEGRGINVAYTGVVSRQNTIKKANGVQVTDFYQVLDLMTDKKEKLELEPE